MNNKLVVQRWSNGSKPIRVLMADHDESLHHAYRRVLTEEGFETVSAANGLECVARLRERVPDLLVIEPELPWGGGDGVLSVMGETPNLSVVPVMVLTSCRDPVVLESVSRFPISDYQIKPLTPEQLVRRLHTMLAHPRLHFTMAEQTGRLECSIARRTGGRVRALHVEAVDGRVVVHGRADSHYVIQLALAAVREAFEASQSQSERIEMDIEIRPLEGRQAHKRRDLSETQDEYYSDDLVPPGDFVPPSEFVPMDEVSLLRNSASHKGK